MRNVGFRVSPLPLQATKRQSSATSPRKPQLLSSAVSTPARKVRSGRKAQVY